MLHDLKCVAIMLLWNKIDFASFFCVLDCIVCTCFLVVVVNLFASNEYGPPDQLSGV